MTAVAEQLELERPWEEVVVTVAELNVDRSYQRQPREDLVGRIARNYDLVLAGYITVNRRADGSLWIVDGQQRWMGARKAGEREMFAMVVDGLTPEEEAAYYTALNRGRRALTSIEIFRSAFRCHDPSAVEIVEVVYDLGGSIAGISGSRETIQAVSALESVHGRGGRRMLVAVLEIIRDSFGGLNRTTCQSQIIMALFNVLTTHPELDRARLTKKLEAIGDKNLRQRAGAIGAAFGSVNEYTYYLAICQTYNHGLRKNLLKPKAKSARTAWRRRHLEQEEG